MKSQILQLAARVLVFSALSTSAAIRYVNVNSANPTPPYSDWTTAATTIQDAVDVGVAGDQILVTNGVYLTGGRVVSETMTNRVAVTNAIMVRSVNGAALTVIHGKGAVRCVYLANGAALVGFTLTNGVADSGGGVWCESTNAIVANCVLTGNSAVYEGGGAYAGTLNNCTLTGNSAVQGGGASGCTLNNCTLTGNSAGYEGGGAYAGTLNNCTLTGNSAYYYGGTVGGAGGGASGCTLNNCTLTGNSAGDGGGGAEDSTLNNCIVYYNSARNGANYDNATLSYSCTIPLPPGGVGNTSAEPQLVDLSHLSAGSPCRGAGRAAYATGLDIDGETWANPPSIGCDEYHSGVVTGPLSVSIQAAYTNVAVGFVVNFTAAIAGRATANRWEFGDGTVVSNQPYASHTWAVAGEYSVIFRAYNDTQPSGISAIVTVHVVAQPVHYVALGSTNPVAPYTSWSTAATNIQDAVDAVSAAGAVVLVTNGVYQTGERVVIHFGRWPVPSRVAVTKAITVRSVNGAAVTVIHGQGAVRCVSLNDGAALAGFTLTSGFAVMSSITLPDGVADTGIGGGAVSCESGSSLVFDCMLTGNSASYGGGADGVTLRNCTLTSNWAYDGGGATSCTLNNCTLTGNSAANYGGGGAYGCTLNNCVLTGNSAPSGGAAIACTLNNCVLTRNSATNHGGGASDGRLNNCIVYYNSAPDGDNYSFGVLSYSCTTPLPSGIGNLTNAPLFLDYAGGSLRLQSNSPCINAGANAFAPAGPDLDGNPRIAGGTVDMGAYEFQSPQSLISYAWLQQYGLPTDGSADVTDGDGDGLNNGQEWRAGTNPTNALSVLRLLSPASGASGVIVSWQSVSGLNYFLDRVTQLGAQPSLLPLATDIVGQPGTTTFTDTNAVGAGPFFYRVGVQE